MVIDYLENYHQTMKIIKLHLIFENKSGPKDIKSIGRHLQKNMPFLKKIL
ncbi:hypothetical protein [Methanosarcina sp.]|jgi:hypothetical protein|nr:hypothetical protein [Methanosarcina sp.]HOW14259.1 hypothetical protein [Methanosarcina sp.]